MTMLTTSDRLSRLIREIVEEGDYRSGELYRSVISDVEKPLFVAALERFRGNISHAAALLGMDRNGFRVRAKRLKVLR